MDKVASEDTRLLYCTTGVLLQKLINQKDMRHYTHIVLDEVRMSWIDSLDLDGDDINGDNFKGIFFNEIIYTLGISIWFIFIMCH